MKVFALTSSLLIISYSLLAQNPTSRIYHVNSNLAKFSTPQLLVK